MAAQSWAVLIGAFLLGSFPTARVVARAVAGVDICAVGDGNPGARNVYRNVGQLAGVFVASVDIGKGAAAVILAQKLGESDWIVRIAGACAVLGHDFSPFLRYQGGQGMAAIAGVFGVLYPWETAAGLLVVALMLALSHNWDLSCGTAFVCFLLSLWFTGHTVAESLYPVFLVPTIGLKKLQQVRQGRHVPNGFA